jgi:hypothetical protein
MNTFKRVSLFTDLKYNIEFIDELNKILFLKDSSIGSCYITLSTSDKICLFLYPKKCPYKFCPISFDFFHPLIYNQEKKEEFYSHFENEGLSRKDIDLLNDFLSKYCFESYPEGLFFASKFLGKELNPDKKKCVFYKYEPDPNYNRYFINDLKLQKFYSLNFSNHLYSVIDKDDLYYGKELKKCNTYGFSVHIDSSHCIKEIKARPSDKSVIVEYYVDYETLQGYLSKVFKLIDEKLVEIDINKLEKII